MDSKLVEELRKVVDKAEEDFLAASEYLHNVKQELADELADPHKVGDRVRWQMSYGRRIGQQLEGRIDRIFIGYDNNAALRVTIIKKDGKVGLRDATISPNQIIK